MSFFDGFADELVKLSDSLDELLGQLRFRHQSKDYNPTLRPLNYDELRQARGEGYDFAKRKATDDRYRKILGTDPGKSFLYATIGGHHAMTPSDQYPGYTHHFKLSPEQLQRALFQVIHAQGSTDPLQGEEGLRAAIEHWKRIKDSRLGQPARRDGKTRQPRIEVVLSDPVKVLSHIARREEREKTAGQKLYHGSPVKGIKTLEAREHKLAKKPAVFATPNPEFALAMAIGPGGTTDSIAVGYEKNLDTGKKRFWIDELKPGAFKVFDRGAYLYEVAPKGFRRQKGLMKEERVSYSAVQVVKAKKIRNIRKALERMGANFNPYDAVPGAMEARKDS